MDHLADAPIANILIIAGIIFLSVGLFGRVGGFIGSIFGNIEAGKNSRVLAGVLGAVLIVGGAWLHQLADKTTAKNSPTATPPSNTPSGPASPVPVAPNTVTPAAPVPSPNTHLPSPKLARVIPAGDKKGLPIAPTGPGSPAPSTVTPAAPAPTPASEFDDRLEGTWNNLTPHSDSIKKIEISRSDQGLNAHAWYSCPSGDCEVGSFPVKMTQGVPMYDYASPGRHRKTSLNVFRGHMLLVSVDLFQEGSFIKRNNWVFVRSTMPDTMISYFARYFREVSPKALALASKGAGAFARGSSTEDAKQRALRACVRDGGPDCKIILVNDDPAD